MSRLALTYSRREWIIEFLLLLAEGTLVWMVAALVMSPFTAQPDPVAPQLAIGLVFVAGLLPRLLYDHGIWGRSFSAIMAVAVALSTLIAVKAVAFPGAPWFDPIWPREAAYSLAFEDSGADIAVWAPIGLSAGVWWLTRFNGPPGLERSRASLRTGAAVCALVAIASAVANAGPAEMDISLAIVFFFAATLIALAIARQGNEATHSRRRLLTTVLLPTLAIVVTASLLASIVTFDVLRNAPDSAAPLGVVLDPVFEILLLILTGIVIVISLPILWLLSMGNYQAPKITPFTGAGQSERGQSALDWHPPDPVRYLLASLFLLAIFYGVARFSMALTRRDLDRLESGEREFGSGRGLGAWLERLRWPFGRGGQDPLAALRNDPAWANTVRIRETYAAWLRWAQQRKFGRESAETALELDQRTGPLLYSADAAAALAELTTIYDDVRYSAVPATREQADRATRAWTTLKTDPSLQPKR